MDGNGNGYLLLFFLYIYSLFFNIYILFINQVLCIHYSHTHTHTHISKKNLLIRIDTYKVSIKLLSVHLWYYPGISMSSQKEAYHIGKVHARATL